MMYFFFKCMISAIDPVQVMLNRIRRAVRRGLPWIPEAITTSQYYQSVHILITNISILPLIYQYERYLLQVSIHIIFILYSPSISNKTQIIFVCLHLLVVNLNKTKSFNRQWCLFYWINKWELFIFVCVYAGNEQGILWQAQKLCAWAFITKICVKNMTRLTSTAPLKGGRAVHWNLWKFKSDQHCSETAPLFW